MLYFVKVFLFKIQWNTLMFVVEISEVKKFKLHELQEKTWAIQKPNKGIDITRRAKLQKLTISSIHMLCPCVPCSPLPIQHPLPASWPYLFFSARKATRLSRRLELQNKSLYRRKVRKIEQKKETGKESHWVTKRDRMREIARKMKAYCRVKGSNFRGRKNCIRKEEETRNRGEWLATLLLRLRRKKEERRPLGQL